MPDFSTIVRNIDKPRNKAEHITTYQNAREIVQNLKRAELESRKTSKALSSYFKEPNPKATAAKVWLFLRTELPYFAEPKTDQTAKTISRMLYDCLYKGGTVDCKHYATFSVGVLNACGVPAWFTFVGQDKNKKKPNHAYCTAMINNELVTIDPCRKRFNSECKYWYKWNIPRTKINN